MDKISHPAAPRSWRRLAGMALCLGLAANLCACASMSRRETSALVGTAVGGVVGAAATGGSTVGTVGGAVVGGAIGNELGKRK